MSGARVMSQEKMMSSAGPMNSAPIASTWAISRSGSCGGPGLAVMRRSVLERRAVARKGVEARQAVAEMHPRHLLPDKDMGLRRDQAGIVERGGEDVDLAGPALTFVGERRATRA